MNRLSWRRMLRWLHLWMGLTVGALFALIALTGSLLVFYPEIDAALNPGMHDDRLAAPAAYDRAIIVLRDTYPDKTGPWRLEVTGASGPIPARYYNPPETAGRAFAPMMVWLSADGERILRRDWWGDYAMTLVYDLHYRLLAGHIGAIVNLDQALKNERLGVATMHTLRQRLLLGAGQISLFDVAFALDGGRAGVVGLFVVLEGGLPGFCHGRWRAFFVHI